MRVCSSLRYQLGSIFFDANLGKLIYLLIKKVWFSFNDHRYFFLVWSLYNPLRLELNFIIIIIVVVVDVCLEVLKWMFMTPSRHMDKKFVLLFLLSQTRPTHYLICLEHSRVVMKHGITLQWAKRGNECEI
jgi:hypothetical protein